MSETADSQYVICPHCDYRHGDAWEWCKSDIRTETCEGCGKQFQCWAEYDVQYIAKPA